MCLAIAQQPGAKLTDEVLNNAAQNNPDGFGYAFCDENGKVRIRKHTEFAELVASYHEDWELYGQSSGFIVHFRWATHGQVCVKNTHPFKLANGGAMIHNGVLTIPGLPKDYSDSLYFANNFISKLPENWYRTPHWRTVMEKFIGAGNKVGCLYPDEIVILNEKAGEWKDNVWYSNTSGFYCKATTYTGSYKSWEASRGADNAWLYEDEDLYAAGYPSYEEWKKKRGNVQGEARTTEFGTRISTYVLSPSGVAEAADLTYQQLTDDYEWDSDIALWVPKDKLNTEDYSQTWEDFVMDEDIEELRWLLSEAMACDVSGFTDEDVINTLLECGSLIDYDDTADNVELVRAALVVGQ